MKSWIITLLALTTLALGGCKYNWKSEFDAVLPEFGHRNWIVVADYAYPSQNSDGIKTIVTGESQTEVLSYVLGQIEKTPHVKPLIMFDQELTYVSEEEAPGVNAYNEALKKIIGSKEASVMPHEDIIKKLDEGSQIFKVLILKTNMTIPYTSVFINLDCHYWSGEKEQRLRTAIEQAKQ